MRKILLRYLDWEFSVLLGIGVFLFWCVGYPYALSFQEQYQMFLMDGDYWCRKLSVPGGFASYVGEYLTQFYVNHLLGALVLAVVYLLIQQLVWRLMKSINRQAETYYPLSFVPVMALWLTQGDENVLLAFPVALILTLAMMWLYEIAGKRRNYLAIIMIPLLYWLAGPAVLMLAAWVLLRQVQTSASKWTGLGIGILALVYALGCILVSSRMVPYPLFRLFYGLDYYRSVEVYSWWLSVTMALGVIVPLLAYWLPAVSKRRWLVSLGTALVLLVAFLMLRPVFYEARKYEVMEYDYLVRCQDWNAIIAKADKKTPDLPMTVCATNLALGMKGLLGERLFDFYQNGRQGLVPPFTRNFSTIMLTGEVYWQLGLVNTAQRFAFESMEAIPNYTKSSRAVKRLVETNLVNGEYKVARKYLCLLEKTLGYRQWAQRTMTLLGNEKAINEHPVYGRMRQLRLQEDIMFNEDEIDHILGQLMMQDKGNGLALQYLLAVPLLDRDIARFMNYMVYVDKLHLGYCPRSCQEAIAFAFAQRNQLPPQGSVNEIVMRRFGEFSKAFAQGGKDAPQMSLFTNTAWYYIICGR